MPNTIKYLLAIAGVLLLLFGLWYVRTVLSYILIAGVISLIGSPITNFLDNLKVGKFNFPRSLAAGLTLLLLMAVFVGFISLFAPVIGSQARAISDIEVSEVISTLQEPLSYVEGWLANFHFSAGNPSDILEDRVSNLLNVTDVTSVFSSLLGALGNIFIAFFSISFICFFFLKEEGLFFKLIIAFSPSKYSQQTEKILVNTKKLLTRYFVGILGQVSIITILVSIGLSIIGIENAFFIGLFAGVINVIPYIGPLIGASIGIILSITTNLNLDFYNELLPLIGKVASVFAIVQLLDNFVFQPFIFSNSVNAHPLEIFILILIAGTVAGIPGMILAIPSYTLIRIIAKEFLSQFKIVQSLTKNL